MVLKGSTHFRRAHPWPWTKLEKGRAGPGGGGGGCGVDGPHAS